MNRRRALAIAGTVTASAAGAALAFSANVGLLGFSRADTSALGELQADRPLSLVADEAPSTTAPGPTTTLPPEVVVQYEDVVVQDPAAPAPPAPAAVESEDEQDDSSTEEADEAPTSTTQTTIAAEATTSTTVASDDEVDHEDHEVEIEHEGVEDDD